MDSVNTLLSTRRVTIIPQPQHAGGTTSFLVHEAESISNDGEGHFVKHAQVSHSAQLVTSLSSINNFTHPLGVPWKAAKDKDFAPVQVYTGFTFDIPNRIVGLPEDKRLRYLDHITS
ncbi:unnamed protein product [Tilletia controversa]|uniref:Uncharacterized protein n=1 Tax=Tilletia caries TaxID=13290 RepID=A0A177THD6_9BASI|nr:hypothetical protein CF335_g6494 [Tilletia laevis]KAE8241723.1 hypothetical protein A4X03_0g8101 [Tilletia caries]CAD6899613.1 unnamed protein product [Tilletia controversa]CAD6886384.1 unnamed protein product [Tilletia caries]CAD6949556.1 unnamed protein product [Tilletia caries]